ncbi:MAG: hypothetical protein NZO16_00120 [Deltaproteobacteria bacterium]|nr:hypothetical protein [Deltaproteobacteria bacterium]
MRALTLIELIIVISIILVITVIFSGRLFDFGFISARSKGEELVGLINSAIIESNLKKTGYILKFDLRNQEFQKLEFSRDNVFPCLQEVKLLCEFTNLFIPVVPDMVAIVNDASSDRTERFQLRLKKSINFVEKNEAVLMIFLDSDTIEGDLTFSLVIREHRVQIEINPVFRFARLAS